MTDTNDPATDILEATYRALCRQGYADLTLADIAAEADRSKASIHHYDSKENLLIEFLEFLYDRHTARLGSVGGQTPRERLFALLDVVLGGTERRPGPEFRTAMLEVNVRAPYDDAIRARLARFDEFLFEEIREVIAAGVDEGDFDERVVPAVAAEFLVTVVAGAHARRVVFDRSSEQFYETMIRFATDHPVAEETAGVAQ